MKKFLIGFVVAFLLVGCVDTPVSAPEALEKPVVQKTVGNALDEKVQMHIPVESMETTDMTDGQQKVDVMPKIPDSQMTITSRSVVDGVLPDRFTCMGQDISPAFEIAHVPAGTESLILIVSSDQLADGKFVHWSTWNIDPTTTTIDENTVPGTMEGINSYETIGYQGPCPHTGEVEVTVDLYAVGKRIHGRPDWTAGHLLINSINAMKGKASFVASVR